ncbi:hypothetical protein C8T65DRAFT_650874 [Cerioporus squamosus]|nr:hypothetical protein C8T65DRAFT_650874 [Cerioporus squamosus]
MPWNMWMLRRSRVFSASLYVVVGMEALPQGSSSRAGLLQSFKPSSFAPRGSATQASQSRMYRDSHRETQDPTLAA